MKLFVMPICGWLMFFFPLSTTRSLASAAAVSRHSADVFLKAKPTPGEMISDITYRVVSTSGAGMEDIVWRSGATGTYSILPSDAPDVIPWKVSVHMDGMTTITDATGDYRNGGKTMCFQGKCELTTDASGPFFNPTFWGEPQGDLKPGMTWTVTLAQPWELGPPGQQTISVVSTDPANGVIVLKREGHGEGSYLGGKSKVDIKKNGKDYHAEVKRGTSHWVGQAVFRHGVVISDELLCDTPVELSAPEIGTIQAHERQYMSLLEHPAQIVS